MEYKKPLSPEEQTDYIAAYKRVQYNIVPKEDAAEFLYRHNYINVISPFKYVFARKNDDGIPEKDENDRHYYDRDVEFSEYKEQYEKERQIYPALYNAIYLFESSFNAIVANEVLRYYHIDCDEAFDAFTDDLRKNIKKIDPDEPEREHMLSEIGKFKGELQKYNSPFIFMDRLSLSALSTIYRECEPKLSKKIFRQLLIRGLTIGYSRKKDFDSMLSILVQIRNCVMHGNSLTILIRYYEVKNNQLRENPGKRKYRNVVRHLLSFGRSQ